MIKWSILSVLIYEAETWALKASASVVYELVQIIKIREMQYLGHAL